MIFYKTLTSYNKKYTNIDNPEQNLYLSKNIKIDRSCWRANLAAVFYGDDFKHKILQENIEKQVSNYFLLNIDDEFSDSDFNKWKEFGYKVVKLSEINQLQYITLKNIEDYVEVIFDNIDDDYIEDEKYLMIALLQYIIMKELPRTYETFFNVLDDIKSGKKRIPSLQDLNLCDVLKNRLLCLNSDKTKETSIEVNDYVDKIIYVMDINSENNREKLKNTTTLFLFLSTIKNCNIFLDKLYYVGNTDKIKLTQLKRYNTFYFYFSNNEKEFKKEFGKNSDRILCTADITIANYYDEVIDYYLRRCENWLKQYNHKFYERFIVKTSLTYKNIKPDQCFIMIRSAYPILDKCI